MTVETETDTNAARVGVPQQGKRAVKVDSAHSVPTQHNSQRCSLLFSTGFPLVFSICTRSHIKHFVHFV